MTTEQEMAQRNLIFKVRSGSAMYGTTTPESDEDFVGVFIPDPEYVVGLHRCDQVIMNTKVSTTKCNTKDDTDCTLYSLPKFIQLAMGNNPNIVELFFASDSSIVFDTPWGVQLRNAYPLFIAKTAYERFKGYALAQRHRMTDKGDKYKDTNYSLIRRFLNYFGLNKRAKITEDITTAHKMAGERRRKYVEVYGFDIKNASHLLRLLWESKELLSTGKLTFPLDPITSAILVGVKKGEVKLEDVIETADRWSTNADKAYKDCKLQKSANFDAINKLQMNMLREFWDVST